MVPRTDPRGAAGQPQVRRVRTSEHQTAQMQARRPLAVSFHRVGHPTAVFLYLYLKGQSFVKMLLFNSKHGRVTATSVKHPVPSVLDAHPSGTCCARLSCPLQFEGLWLGLWAPGDTCRARFPWGSIAGYLSRGSRLHPRVSPRGPFVHFLTVMIWGQKGAQ